MPHAAPAGEMRPHAPGLRTRPQRPWAVGAVGRIVEGGRHSTTENMPAPPGRITLHRMQQCARGTHRTRCNAYV